MIRRAAVAMVAIGLVAGSSHVLFAQGKQPAPKGSPVKISGTVDQVVAQGILVKQTDGKMMALAFPPAAKVTMAGNATPDILKPGMFVQFTVTLDEKGKPSGEATKIQITEQSNINTPGITSEKGPDAKPGEPGPYFVRGTVRSYREGSLAVSAGSKALTVTVGAGASIPVTVGDWSLASPGDTISGDAQAFAANPQFTPCMAERIEIKAIQPITGKKKKR